MKVGEKIDLGNGEVEILQVLKCEDCGELEVIVKHEDGFISTEYFTPADELEEEIEEVKCPCCGQLTEEKYIDEVAVEEELVDTLERIADELEEVEKDRGYKLTDMLVKGEHVYIKLKSGIFKGTIGEIDGNDIELLGGFEFPDIIITLAELVSIVVTEEEYIEAKKQRDLKKAKGFKSKKNEIIESAIITIENRQASFMNELMDDVREILKEI